MEKQVGIFKVSASDPWPVNCSIKDSRNNEIRFDHTDINDLLHALTEIRKYAKYRLQSPTTRDESELI